MSVGSANRRNSYTGTGALATYSFTFKIFEESDLEVITRVISTGVETVLTLTTDYTVNGEGEESGGTITLVAGNLASTKKITIRYKPDLLQDLDLRNQGDYYPEGTEDALDKLAKADIYQQDDIDRSVKLPKTLTSSDFDPQLPGLPASNPGASLVLNGDGDGFEWGPTGAEISAAEGYAQSASDDADAAATSASAASTSASAAATSASAASTSASAAAASAAAAAAASGFNTETSETHSAPHLISAAGSITFTAGRLRVKKYVAGSGAARVSGSIQVGTIEGQELLIMGCHDTNTLEIDNPTNVITKGKAILADNDAILFNWDNTQAKWIEISRNN